MKPSWNSGLCKKKKGGQNIKSKNEEKIFQNSDTLLTFNRFNVL